MARPNLSAALGRESVYGDVPAGLDPAITPSRRRPGRPPREDGATWEETHSRATYHLPKIIQEAVTAEAASSGRTKSRVVADALRQHLKIKA